MGEKAVYTLFSSSDGNCVYFKNGENEYLIDCGVSARALETALRGLGSSVCRIKAVFVTHEHSDHIRGLETLCRKSGFAIYAPAGCCAPLARVCPHASPRIIPLEMNGAVETEGAAVTPFATPHDSASSCGYTVELDGVKFGVATDMGYVTKTTARALEGCRAVVIESNHDIDMLLRGDYPENVKRRILGNYGHLSNKSCAEFVPYLAHCGAESLVLAHLSPRNNTPEAAYKASFDSLCGYGAEVSNEFGKGDIRLAVAPHSGACRVI